jgi:hypothetical protein
MRLLTHPRYRAGYDFLLLALRLSGEVPTANWASGGPPLRTPARSNAIAMLLPDPSSEKTPQTQERSQQAVQPAEM